MVYARCNVRDCELPIQEVAHLDEGVQVLHEHYRVVHPTKAFYENYQLETLEVYNRELGDHFTQHYGYEWDREGNIPGLVRYCQQYILTDADHKLYCKDTFEAAEKYVADNPQNQNQAQPPVAVEEDDFVDIPNPARWDVIPPVQAAPRMPRFRR